MKDVGVAIVAYNSDGVIGECLDACLRFGLTRIVVVDNSAQEGTRAAALARPGVQLLQNADNKGFAGAVNQAMRLLETPMVLILNPDTIVLGGIEPLVQELHDPAVGIAGGMLLGAEGQPQVGFSLRRFPTPAALSFEVLGWNRLFPGNAVNRSYRCFDLRLDRAQDAEQPAGAFLLLSRQAWERAGGFDEKFHPVWFEDVDYCYRLARLGYRIRYSPNARAHHFGGHSVGRLPRKCQQLYWYGSLLRYAAKHFQPAGRRVVCAAVVIGSVPRMFFGAVFERSLAPFVVFATVLRLAVGCMIAGRVQDIGVSQEVGTAVG